VIYNDDISGCVETGLLESQIFIAHDTQK